VSMSTIWEFASGRPQASQFCCPELDAGKSAATLTASSLEA
jgi:hypothetical protein